jgi:hypothetical protein
MKEAAMNQRNSIAIALVLALAAVAALVAATRTTQLGAAATTPKVSAAQIAHRNAQLDRVEVALLRAVRRRPPALPPVPKIPRLAVVPVVHSAPVASAVPVSAPAPVASAAPRQAVIYVRPAPIVHIVHRHGGEHDAEHETHQEGADD